MIKIVDIATALGSIIQHNQTLEKIAGWESGKIIQKTGISRRYIAECSAEELAINALKKLKTRNDLSEIDLIISVTNTPQILFPTISNFAHTILDLNENCKCLGINSGCTGFVEAYELVNLYFKNNLSSKALIITYDTYSHFLDHEDISTRALFSDGAAVSLLAKDPTYHKIVDTKVSTAKNLNESLIFKKETNRIIMKGSEVFTFGLRYVKKDLQNMASKYPKSLVILHQAGKVMIDGLMKVVGEGALTPCNYKKYGNLVSSSIPFLLYENLAEFNNSKSIIMSGFGVGLSSHTIVLSKD